MDDITALIDRRIQLKARADQIKKELEEIDREIKEECEPGEVLLGSEGYGYKLHVQETLEYGVSAIEHLRKKKLLDPFIKISTTGLEKLAKDGKMPWAEVDKIRQTARVKQTLVLRECIPDEAKIIA